ncbi:hypothetical protein ACIN8IBEIGE_20219 [Acinetobacter sp. 8I-beige]|nr:hypothetical protein ACIN8IBEIGE_20219 [Acinetobacter sp. 8I-beige]
MIIYYAKYTVALRFEDSLKQKKKKSLSLIFFLTVHPSRCDIYTKARSHH